MFLEVPGSSVKLGPADYCLNLACTAFVKCSVGEQLINPTP